MLGIREIEENTVDFLNLCVNWIYSQAMNVKNICKAPWPSPWEHKYDIKHCTRPTQISWICRTEDWKGLQRQSNQSPPHWKFGAFLLHWSCWTPLFLVTHNLAEESNHHWIDEANEESFKIIFLQVISILNLPPFLLDPSSQAIKYTQSSLLIY